MLFAKTIKISIALGLVLVIRFINHFIIPIVVRLLYKQAHKHTSTHIHPYKEIVNKLHLKEFVLIVVIADMWSWLISTSVTLNSIFYLLADVLLML